MLILGRKPGETIEIGSDITVRIVSIKGRTAKVAIDAPQHVQILRGELCKSSSVGPDSPSQLRRRQEIVPAA